MAGDFNICSIGQNDHGTSYTFRAMCRDLQLGTESVLSTIGHPATYPIVNNVEDEGLLVNKSVIGKRQCLDHVFTSLPLHHDPRVIELNINGLALSDHAAIEVELVL